MVDLILICLFSYQLHRMASQRGVAPWPFVLNYVAIVFLMIIAFGYGFISFFGPDGFKSDEGIKAAMMFEPFAIMFEVFLFIYFRKRIQKTNPVNNHDDFTPPPPPTKEKKDLSYFR